MIEMTIMPSTPCSVPAAGRFRVAVVKNSVAAAYSGDGFCNVDDPVDSVEGVAQALAGDHVDAVGP